MYLSVYGHSKCNVITYCQYGVFKTYRQQHCCCEDQAAGLLQQPRTISTTVPAATLPLPATTATPPRHQGESKSNTRDKPVNVLRDIPIKIFHPEKKDIYVT